MKTKFILLILVSFLINTSFADVRKGKCQFYGSEPPHLLSNQDGMEVYYSDEFYMKGTSSGYHIYTGSGTIWIIFHNRKGYETFKFQGNASIQTCQDF